MKEFFEQIAHKNKISYHVEKSTWFNGHAYFPIYTYGIEFHEKDTFIKLSGEHRISERSKQSYSNPITFLDVYLWHFKFELPLKWSDFSIAKSTWFERLFLKYKTVRILPCTKKNSNLMSTLNFAVYTEAWAPKPIVYSKFRNGYTELTMSFNTSNKHIENALNAFILMEGISSFMNNN